MIQHEGARLGLELTAADAWWVVRVLGSQGSLSLDTVREFLRGHAVLAWGR